MIRRCRRYRSASEFPRVAAAVIHQDRIGYRLLTGYYVPVTVLVVVICAVLPAAAGIVIGGAVVAGVILLTYVSVANRHALRPLEEHWPRLAQVPTRGRNGGPGVPSQPHKVTGIFYVLALLLIAAAGGLTTSVADASAASATTQVTILSCNETSRVETCGARWEADGRAYAGTINWASESGTVQGRYNPKTPDAVYSASLPYLNGTTVILGVFIVVLGSVCAFICLFYARRTRAIPGRPGSSSATRHRTVFLVLRVRHGTAAGALVPHLATFAQSVRGEPGGGFRPAQRPRPGLPGTCAKCRIVTKRSSGGRPCDLRSRSTRRDRSWFLAHASARPADHAATSSPPAARRTDQPG